jgi:hypothetical protein
MEQLFEVVDLRSRRRRPSGGGPVRVWSTELFKFGLYTQSARVPNLHTAICVRITTPEKIKIIPFNVSFMKRARTMKYCRGFFRGPLFATLMDLSPSLFRCFLTGATTGTDPVCAERGRGLGWHLYRHFHRFPSDTFAKNSNTSIIINHSPVRIHNFVRAFGQLLTRGEEEDAKEMLL